MQSGLVSRPATMPVSTRICDYAHSNSFRHDATMNHVEEKVVMACFSCRSENVKAFTSEINIFLQKANPTKNVLASPKLLVCLDCGLADVLLSEDELRNLREMYSSVNAEIADINGSLPPKSPLGISESNGDITTVT